jgi:hypothetical protein
VLLEARLDLGPGCGDPARQVSGKRQVHMKGFGQSIKDLPVWVQQLLDEVEAGIPAALRSQVLGDAILVLVK